MNCAFADSYYYFAILNPKDAAHRKALDFSRAYLGSIVTTAWILTEVADGLCRPATRYLFRQLVAKIEADPGHEIIPATDKWFRRGVSLYDSRPDKPWSLTDCISFEIMSEMKIQHALTADHHFMQAGFSAVLAD